MNPLSLMMCVLPLLAPPSGRPPVGPLERHSPRVYDVSFMVSITTPHQINAGLKESFNIRDTPIVMPVIFRGSYHTVNSDSLGASLWLTGVEDHTLQQRTRLDRGLPFSEQLAVIPIVQYRGQMIRWELRYRAQSFSSRMKNEIAAGEIAWPRQWPAEVQDGLRPQMYIESDHEFFKQAVETVSEGNMRMVPPYYAAKDLVRYCIKNIQVSGSGIHRDEFQALLGLSVQGALKTAQTGRGTKNDLVCVCVAMLRAADIPARAIIGIEKKTAGVTLVTWAEFFLPDVGWVPFDPAELRGKGIEHKNVRDPWPEFATMKDLNDRIPLSYHFIPARPVESPQYPAVWGWDPRPKPTPNAVQRIIIKMVSRGSGTPDPG